MTPLKARAVQPAEITSAEVATDAGNTLDFLRNLEGALPGAVDEGLLKYLEGVQGNSIAAAALAQLVNAAKADRGGMPS